MIQIIFSQPRHGERFAARANTIFSLQKLGNETLLAMSHSMVLQRRIPTETL
jgi:hypothetical protein